MSENNTIQEEARPSAALQSLAKLVGTWQISGPTIEGQVIYEWMDGGFFLIQHFDLLHDGRKVKGIEMIGHERKFGAEEASEDIQSHVFDNVGNTLDYVYELDGDTLIIWGGMKGSPAYFKGTFSADGNHLSGSWVWPGGGYESNMTRIK